MSQHNLFLKPHFLVYPRDLKNANFKWHLKGVSRFVCCIENIQGVRWSFSTSEQEFFLCLHLHNINIGPIEQHHSKNKTKAKGSNKGFFLPKRLIKPFSLSLSTNCFDTVFTLLYPVSLNIDGCWHLLALYSNCTGATEDNLLMETYLKLPDLDLT